MKLAPLLKKKNLEYSNVNGANIRFLYKKNRDGKYEVDDYFISVLSDLGLRELVLPFESNNNDILSRYASGKYNPNEMNPYELVRILKKYDFLGSLTQGKSNFFSFTLALQWSKNIVFGQSQLPNGFGRSGEKCSDPYSNLCRIVTVL